MSASLEVLLYPLPFLAVVTVIVFVHELGHYLVALICRVPVETVSIGIGREVLGHTDTHGTRWRLSLYPIGGFIRMREGEGGFSTKPLWARAAVMAAGPAASFAFTIAVFAFFFMTIGENVRPARIDKVLPDTPAEHAGFKPGDKIVATNGAPISQWEDFVETTLIHPGDRMDVEIVRDGAHIVIPVVPAVVKSVDDEGKAKTDVRIGIRYQGVYEVVKLPLLPAIARAVHQTVWLIRGTILSFAQMADGRRPPEHNNGLVSVAQTSHHTLQHGGGLRLVYLSGFLSASLGLANLFPIPMLDGGNLLLYAIEVVTGRPPSRRVVDYSFRFGLSVLGLFALFALWNDLVGLGLLDFMHATFS